MLETYAPGRSLSLVARQHGIAPNQLFSWRRLYAEGALSAVSAGEEVVVPASDYRSDAAIAIPRQVRDEVLDSRRAKPHRAEAGGPRQAERMGHRPHSVLG